MGATRYRFSCARAETEERHECENDREVYAYMVVTGGCYMRASESWPKKERPSLCGGGES